VLGESFSSGQSFQEHPYGVHTCITLSTLGCDAFAGRVTGSGHTQNGGRHV
jgi:hypothetical protein